MRSIKKVLTLTVLSTFISSYVAQQDRPQSYNGTIFQFLNDSDVSVSHKLAEFLMNSSDYQSIIDTLSDKNQNLTFFLPTDEVYYDAISPSNPRDTNSTQTTLSDTSYDQPMNAAEGIQAFHENLGSRLRGQVIQERGDIRNYASNGTDWGSVTTDAKFADQFSYLDIIHYHLVNRTVEIDNSTNTLVLETLLRNESVVSSGSGAPLVIQKRLTDISDQNNKTTQNVVRAVSNKVATPNNKPWTIGTGLETDAHIFYNHTYQTSNGIIYVIDKILIPPVNASETFSSINNISNFNWLINQPAINSSLHSNSSSNITVFAPINSALQNLNIIGLTNETLKGILGAHVVQGVYYSTNLTSASSKLKSMDGSSLNFSNSSNNQLKVNNVNIVKPNILFDYGVVHLIDGVLNYTAVQTNNTGASSSTTSSTQTTSKTSTQKTTTQVATQTAVGGAFPTTQGSADGLRQTDSSGPFPTPIINSASKYAHPVVLNALLLFAVINFN